MAGAVLHLLLCPMLETAVQQCSFLFKNAPEGILSRMELVVRGILHLLPVTEGPTGREALYCSSLTDGRFLISKGASAFPTFGSVMQYQDCLELLRNHASHHNMS
uniref:WGS project CBMI000000000 data, contig CS3069_c003601 n=1 Tax=Fusarium clavum TaxID=2594811 RepID=A0A090N5Y0_9HYPO|nr:unnamed protein product [Fusarium clavum]